MKQARKEGSSNIYPKRQLYSTDLFILILFGSKELTMAECKKVFFDELKRLRKIRQILTENGV